MITRYRSLLTLIFVAGIALIIYNQIRWLQSPAPSNLPGAITNIDSLSAIRLMKHENDLEERRLDSLIHIRKETSKKQDSIAQAQSVADYKSTMVGSSKAKGTIKPAAARSIKSILLKNTSLQDTAAAKSH